MNYSTNFKTSSKAKWSAVAVGRILQDETYIGLNYSTNFKTSSKAKWSAVAVGRILQDETYIGTLIQGKCATPNHKIKKKVQKPKEDWARIPGAHEAIINEKDFINANKVLARDTRIAPGGTTVYPFSGIIKWGNCHENMIRKTSQAGEKRYIYFVCCNGCKKHRISEDTLSEIVAVAIQSHINNITNLERVLLFIDSLPLKKDEVQRLDKQIALKNADIERYKKLVFSLYENLQNGILNETEYREMKNKYNALCEEAQSAVLNLTREIENIINSKGEKNVWIEHFKQYHNFTELTRKMLISVIEEITVYTDSRLDILFKYQYNYQRTIDFAKTVGKLYTLPDMEQSPKAVM